MATRPCAPARGSVTPPVRPLPIVLHPSVVRIGNASAADAASADEALLQRVILALHHPAGHLIALIAPLRRTGAAMMRVWPPSVSRHRGARADHQHHQPDRQSPHRYLLVPH